MFFWSTSKRRNIFHGATTLQLFFCIMQVPWVSWRVSDPTRFLGNHMSHWIHSGNFHARKRISKHGNQRTKLGWQTTGLTDSNGFTLLYESKLNMMGLSYLLLVIVMFYKICFCIQKLTGRNPANTLKEIQAGKDQTGRNVLYPVHFNKYITREH